MVRRSALCWTLAGVALMGGQSARASGMSSVTGDAEKDFVLGKSGVTVIPNNPMGNGNAYHVYQDPSITAAGQISGWNIKDVRLSYDKASDTMSVGVNFYSIAGDADGNGVVGTMRPSLSNSGGVENPSLSGRESIAVRFALDGDKSHDIVAGVPSGKSVYGPGGAYNGTPLGLDGFLVAQVKSPFSKEIASNFGTPLLAHMGNLLFDPSAAHPDFEFTLKNFSKLPGYDPTKGFQDSAFAGSVDDVIAGEDTTRFTLVSAGEIQPPPCSGPNCVPEPASILAWSALAAAGAWSARRRRVARTD